MFNQTNDMEKKENISSRRKFFLWGLGITSSVTALKFLFPKKNKTEMIKMLSEDGTLVEVDPRFIKKTGNKVSDQDIHNWIQNKPTIQ